MKERYRERGKRNSRRAMREKGGEKTDKQEEWKGTLREKLKKRKHVKVKEKTEEEREKLFRTRGNRDTGEEERET